LNLGFLQIIIKEIKIKQVIVKNNLGWNYALQAIEMGSLMKNLN